MHWFQLKAVVAAVVVEVATGAVVAQVGAVEEVEVDPQVDHQQEVQADKVDQPLTAILELAILQLAILQHTTTILLAATREELNMLPASSSRSCSFNCKDVA